jgi:DnaK suppressor protein
MKKLEKMAERLQLELEDTRTRINGMDQEVMDLTRDNDDEGGAARNHMGDEGSNDYERERLASIQSEMNVRVQLIEAAQQRIADGTYGICQRCGKKIPAARLEAMPFAAYDIACQEIVDAEAETPGFQPNEPTASDATAPA